MSEQSPKPPPGWYPDGGRQRYWNGEAWTSQYWDVAAGQKKSFWTTGRIVAAVVAAVVLLGGIATIGVFALGSFTESVPTTKADAVDMCVDFADDDLKHGEEAELSDVVAKRLDKDYYLVRGTYTVRGGSGPLRCEVEYDPSDDYWYLDALRRPKENGGPDQSVEIDVMDD